MLRQLEALAKFLRVTLLNHPPMRTARSGHEERGDYRWKGRTRVRGLVAGSREGYESKRRQRG